MMASIGRLPIEQAVEIAAKSGLKYIDVELDTGAKRSIHSMMVAQHPSGQIKELGVKFGLDTLSAVNNAEVCRSYPKQHAYLKAYIDVASKLGAELP
jgi:hypothetical protein